MNVIEMFDTNNNKLKYQGKPMIRRVNWLKARNKRIRKTRLNIDFSLAFANFGISLKKASESFNKLAHAVKEYEGGVIER